ncbi:hypothetical protein CNR22_17555 [Sphingobacteriaceae bacterium]|nr:hypothetical protein CNR22_17555 [Sphingobacteriaceae bacterium]
MRIGIALIVLTDLLIRFADLKAHYTDEGIWPTELIHNFGWNTGYWSLHTQNGSYAFEVILFALHFVFALCLLVGFKTRFFTLLVWLMTISLHNRNLFVLQAGDDLLRLVLMWGIFLPWQSFYAVDAKQISMSKRQNLLVNFAYFLLIASVYFFSANLKYSPQWHSEGSAMYYALSLEQLRLPLGEWIYHYPLLLKCLTWFVLYSEYLIAPLILLPSKNGRLRFIAFLLLVVIHLGIGLTLYVGLFFIIGIVSAVALLPAFAMDRLEKFFRIKKTSFIIKTEKLFFVSWSRAILCGFLIFLCLFINLSTTPWFPFEPEDELAYVGNSLRLNQYWGMFSPGVLQKDGWFVYHGRDSIGRQWDLRRNQDYVDYSKPKRIVSNYSSDRWRKLAENMQSDHYTFLRPLYCAYLVKEWNKSHKKKRITSLSVYFMEKENLPDYKTTEPVKTLQCLCYAY